MLHERALSEIAALSDLPDDWDTYGAVPVTECAVKAAGAFTSQVISTYGPHAKAAIAPFDITPLAHGGLQVEWRCQSMRIEVDFGPEGAIGYLFKERVGDSWTYEEGDNVSVQDAIRQVLRAILEE